MLREIAGDRCCMDVSGCAALLVARSSRCATDSEEILAFCKQRGFVARMTSAAHRSGPSGARDSTLIPADVY